MVEESTSGRQLLPNMNWKGDMIAHSWAVGTRANSRREHVLHRAVPRAQSIALKMLCLTGGGRETVPGLSIACATVIEMPRRVYVMPMKRVFDVASVLLVLIFAALLYP